MERHVLSKSTFLRGCQCVKSLYLFKYHASLKNTISSQQQQIFNHGIDFGVEARSLFAGGYDASAAGYKYIPEAISKTSAWVQNLVPVIYEAAFQFQRVLAVVDILVKGENGWHAYEVKSSSKLTDTHLLDAALQYFVISNSGIELESFSVIHKNREREFTESDPISERVVINNLTEPIRNRQAEIKAKINELKQVLSIRQVPKVELGEHCLRPYPCDFSGFCKGPVQELPLFKSMAI